MCHQIEYNSLLSYDVYFSLEINLMGYQVFYRRLFFSASVNIHAYQEETCAELSWISF